MSKQQDVKFCSEHGCNFNLPVCPDCAREAAVNEELAYLDDRTYADIDPNAMLDSDGWDY